ncbi:MAG TPA: AI-2E family transporter [Patescibacteria group bacterium]|nr:AI-2E family transporter [Patescibacteria group bacterium]
MRDTTRISLPLYVQYTTVLLGAILTAYCLYEGRYFLMPILFSAFFALLLYPLSHWLEERWKMSRAWSCGLCLGVTILFLAGFVFLLYGGFSAFREVMPEVLERFEQLYERLAIFIEKKLGVVQREQLDQTRQMVNNFFTKSGSMVSSTFSIVTGILALLVMMPTLIFMFLYYRENLKEFLKRMVHPKDKHDVEDVTQEVPEVIINYVKGVGMRSGIEAALNTIGLAIIGVPYWFVLGPITAIFTIIPYVGTLIGAILPTLVALVTMQSPWYALAVIGWYAAIQVLEEVWIEPHIVGAKVKLNPLAAFVAVIIGGTLWGPAGLILFIPMTATLKVIAEHVDAMRPIAYLLGAEEAETKK